MSSLITWNEVSGQTRLKQIELVRDGKVGKEALQIGLASSWTLRCPELIRAIIDSGVDVNIGQIPPLHLALYTKAEDAFTLLLESGADANVEHHGYRLLRYMLIDGTYPEKNFKQVLDHNGRWQLLDDTLSKTGNRSQRDFLYRETSSFVNELQALLVRSIVVIDVVSIIIDYSKI